MFLMVPWKKPFLGLTLVACFSVSSTLLNAQMQHDSENNMASVTGCLKQGVEPGGFYLFAQDGKMYEVTGKGLAAYLQHTVTVTGTVVTLPDAQEQKKMASEKKEAGPNSYADIKVSQIRMVSPNCM